MRAGSSGNLQQSISHEEKVRKARGILNKFTVEKFEKLSDKVIAMVTTEEVLADVVVAILEKARNETHFSALYAEMCLKLSQVPLPLHLGSKQAATFRRILLNKCGELFYEGFAKVEQARREARQEAQAAAEAAKLKFSDDESDGTNEDEDNSAEAGAGAGAGAGEEDGDGEGDGEKAATSIPAAEDWCCGRGWRCG